MRAEAAGVQLGREPVSDAGVGRLERARCCWEVRRVGAAGDVRRARRVDRDGRFLVFLVPAEIGRIEEVRPRRVQLRDEPIVGAAVVARAERPRCGGEVRGVCLSADESGAARVNGDTVPAVGVRGPAEKRGIRERRASCVQLGDEARLLPARITRVERPRRRGEVRGVGASGEVRGAGRIDRDRDRLIEPGSAERRRVGERGATWVQLRDKGVRVLRGGVEGPRRGRVVIGVRVARHIRRAGAVDGERVDEVVPGTAQVRGIDQRRAGTVELGDEHVVIARRGAAVDGRVERARGHREVRGFGHSGDVRGPGRVDCDPHVRTGRCRFIQSGSTDERRVGEAWIDHEQLAWITVSHSETVRPVSEGVAALDGDAPSADRLVAARRRIVHAAQRRVRNERAVRSRVTAVPHPYTTAGSGSGPHPAGHGTHTPGARSRR